MSDTQPTGMSDTQPSGHQPRFTGEDVNQVLRTVVAMTEDGDVQLSILCYALVIACRSCGVSRATALHEFGKTFDLDLPMVPLPKTS